jgi:hypothetical protein
MRAARERENEENELAILRSKQNVRGPRSEVRGPRSEVRGPRSEVRGPRSEVVVFVVVVIILILATLEKLLKDAAAAVDNTMIVVRCDERKQPKTEDRRSSRPFLMPTDRRSPI